MSSPFLTPCPTAAPPAAITPTDDHLSILSFFFPKHPLPLKSPHPLLPPPQSSACAPPRSSHHQAPFLRLLPSRSPPSSPSIAFTLYPSAATPLPPDPAAPNQMSHLLRFLPRSMFQRRPSSSSVPSSCATVETPSTRPRRPDLPLRCPPAQPDLTSGAPAKSLPSISPSRNINPPSLISVFLHFPPFSLHLHLPLGKINKKDSSFVCHNLFAGARVWMAFVRWEEKVISTDKGHRLVHYLLRDGQGGKVVAVVGREKSLRHMSYSVTRQFSEMMAATMDPSSCSPKPSLFSYSPSSALDFAVGGGFGCMKWRSRRELVDWLSSIVSDKIPFASLPMSNRFLESEDTEPIGIPTSKVLSSGAMGHLSKEFSWLGSAWDCRKKRKHYRSFRRNGITISVHDFVHVLAEDYKRLVAYVEDLYEDMRANRMVVVQWFHKVDEVGIVLPSDISGREIFFSRCLQDLSIECIDGLAAILSAQDFDKFQNDAKHKFSSWDPYMCQRQIDNDVKPFDITQVQGYWSQELLRLMYATPGTSLKLRLKITHGGSKGNPNRDVVGGSKERSRLNDGDNSTPGAAMDRIKSRSASVTGSRGEKHVRMALTPPLLRKELLKLKLQQQHQHLVPGCHVEVLSEDSGVRGCWFRCVVLKRHHDKVKVRYEDVQDADDTGNLEEWVLSSRVASTDKLGIRSRGRPVVRPDPSHCSMNPRILDVGSIVDAWWHDGWWEGIVVSKELEGKLRVYFPGEQQFSIFGLGDLRRSQEWVSNTWNELADRLDMATSLLSDIDREKRLGSSSDTEVTLVQSSPMWIEAETRGGGLHVEPKPMSTPDTGKRAASKPISILWKEKRARARAHAPNLTDVCRHLIDNLNWSSSRKRARKRELGKGSSGTKRRCGSGSSSSGGSQEEAEEAASNACSKLLLPVVDNKENYCKIGGSDRMLVTPMALCSSLVMSQ